MSAILTRLDTLTLAIGYLGRCGDDAVNDLCDVRRLLEIREPEAAREWHARRDAERRAGR